MDLNNDISGLEPGLPRPIEAYPTPDDPPWNGWIAICVWIFSVLLVVFLPMFFLAPYLMQQGINFGDNARLRDFIFTDPTAVILQLAPIILAHALTLFAAWFVVTSFNRYSFRETLGWEMKGFRVWHAVGLTIGFYALLLTLTLVFGETENEFEKLIKSSRYAAYLVAFFATFTAPIVEEVVYRGLLYSAFQRRFGKLLAITFVTYLFTLVHVPQYWPNFATIIVLLSLSLTLTLIRMWTGNLLPCIVLHTVFNGINSALLLADPYIRTLEPVVEPTATTLVK